MDKLNTERMDQDFASQLSILRKCQFLINHRAEEPDFVDLLQKMTFENHGKDQQVYERGDSTEKVYIIFKGKIGFIVKDRNMSDIHAHRPDFEDHYESDQNYDAEGFNETTEYDIDYIQEEDESAPENLDDDEDFFLSGLNVKGQSSSKKCNNALNEMNVSNYSLHHLVQKLNTILQEGDLFGEEDVLQNKNERTASAICIQDCQIGVISKYQFSKLMSNIERRVFNEKINLLQKIPAFSKLTRTTLGKMSHFLNLKITPKDCLLFKEGDTADNVFIIQTGEFEVLKKYKIPEKNEEDIEKIKDNPLKAKKIQQRFFKAQKQNKEQEVSLYIIGNLNLLGEEDIVKPYIIQAKQFQNQQLMQPNQLSQLTQSYMKSQSSSSSRQPYQTNQSVIYTTSAKCISQTANVLSMKTEDFLKLQQHSQAWKQIMNDCETKIRKVAIRMVDKIKTTHLFEKQKSQGEIKLESKYTDYTSVDNYLTSKQKIQEKKQRLMKKTLQISTNNLMTNSFQDSKDVSFSLNNSINQNRQNIELSPVKRLESPKRLQQLQQSIIEKLPSLKSQNRVSSISQMPTNSINNSPKKENTQIQVNTKLLNSLKMRLQSQPTSPYTGPKPKYIRSNSIHRQSEDRFMNTAYTLKPNSKLKFYQMMNRKNKSIDKSVASNIHSTALGSTFVTHNNSINQDDNYLGGNNSVMNGTMFPSTKAQNIHSFRKTYNNSALTKISQNSQLEGRYTKDYVETQFNIKKKSVNERVSQF
ncbi:UNKNOWN [Stylonychia lemnae]|uniref:Cyclic nucleotide-binding domain-containing protein n=1 Tax=Stylonychia lemnae TaxID=5949 RepID=A0A078AEN6_STYLE|nr:UNKNOWN [Stylonychia lemnae]|eukprot:CDW79368.1 UNKNOWN [Stylonychia lemnae]